MKRIIYILPALTVLMVVACSKHMTDAPAQNGLGADASYIFFEAGILDISETKAVELIEQFPSEDGTTFGVVGYYEDGQNIFSSYSNGIANVYKDDGIFKYDDLAPWMGNEHTFHAFYPYDELKSSLDVADNIPYINYMQPSSPRNMRDILGAYAQVTDETALEPVELQFQHLLWAFNIVIRNSQTSESTSGDPITDPAMTIRKVDLSISGFPQMGSLKLDSEYIVEPSSAKVDLDYNLYSYETGEQIAAGQSKTYGPLLFMPVSSLNYRVTIEYTTAAGVRDAMTYPAAGEYRTVSNAFDRGKAYSLTINKNNDKFFVVEEFKPEDWTSNEFEHTFQ